MRRLLMLAAAVGIAAGGALPASAGGGGHGCVEPMTSGAGAAVDISKSCFRPIVAWLGSARTVTFTNHDQFVHTVTPAAAGLWTERILEPGDSFTVTLAGAGIYPFYCRFHQNMGGALVLGDPERLATTSAGVSTTAPETSPATLKAEPASVGWPIATGVGLPAVGLAAYAAGRRRRRP